MTGSTSVARRTSAPAGVRRATWLGVALLLAVTAAALSLAVGTRPVPLSAVLDALVHGGSSPDALVVRSLRVPRAAIGLTAGAALGLAGAALQAVTRNPLADPGILGLSQGAAAGVVFAIALGWANGFDGYVWYAFTGAVLAACVVYAIASRGRGGASPVKLALAASALTGALIVVGADLVARTLVPPLEIPVGALTSLVGGPYLLWLLGRSGRR
ncbi:iron chelate uptake ABC transporter family permease subunit [Streptomyces mirabilis]|uniref:iron chelate uptake ABC transporter family permease subunit n=1 Tax=Streptomyces mirabilis TaxID=68239 RepID=UPI00368A74BF